MRETLLNMFGACSVVVEDILYRTYFPVHFPARSALGADGLALGALCRDRMLGDGVVKDDIAGV